jgi:hypothetical protein
LLLSRAFRSGGRLPEPVESTLVPSRGFRAPMIPPGDKVLLSFAVPDTVPLEKLQAVVWTFLHLGAVGKRSRRGYGSLLWRPAQDDLLADWPPLWPSHHLTNREALEGYLRSGFEKVRSILGVPETGARTGGAGERLQTTDQVFVGKELPGGWEAAGGGGAGGGRSLEDLLHGLNEESRGGEPERSQLGFGTPRLPSPMLWRVFSTANGRGVLPVMTWFPCGYEDGSSPCLAADGELDGYVGGDLGFETSLAGGRLAAAPEEEDEDEVG